VQVKEVALDGTWLDAQIKAAMYMPPFGPQQEFPRFACFKVLGILRVSVAEGAGAASIYKIWDVDGNFVLLV
jgi:hypothetical protein